MRFHALAGVSVDLPSLATTFRPSRHWCGRASSMTSLGASLTMVSPLSARAVSSEANRGEGGRGGNRPRRLIVDTDLGLDDLVALAILGVQQSMQQSHLVSGESVQQYTSFHISGVTIGPGISNANAENAALLRRLLPPNTPVYISGNGDTPWKDKDKPVWWTRTAQRVAQFLSSLPPSLDESVSDLSAEQFIADNLDDPDVDLLCMAPLTTVDKAIQLRSDRQSTGSPKASLYVMGGIRCTSKMTKRGKSTAPFGYHDVVAEAAGDETSEARDQFGEFNFALDIDAARTVLSNAPTRLIPVEACTLVPKALRPSEPSVTLSSILTGSPSEGYSAKAPQLYNSQSILFKLLNHFGTTETQWDSITAAIYCNALGTACISHGSDSVALEQIDSRQLHLSDLGALSYPDCQLNGGNVGGDHSHWVYPTFTMDDETAFFHYLSHLLYASASDKLVKDDVI